MNYVTQTTVESGHKFSLFPSSRKKDKNSKPRFTPDCAGLRGALSWRVVAEDCSGVHTTIRSHSREVDAIMGISPDSLVLIQDNLNHDTLFLTSTKSVIGWTALPNSIRIYFHQGEAIILHSKDWESEDMSEISQRLKAVTNGAPTQEFTLRRNQLGQLGFHVQYDGLITEVENFGYAWQTGLRQGSRLVEICKHPVTTLTHEQMVDLLKTSMTVTVTVIPPYPDGSPRQGCNLSNCSYAFGGFEGDYENVSGEGDKTSVKPGSKQAPSTGKMRYERSLSPPRSSSSSGYGTGSSSKSFMVEGARFPVNGTEGTMTSSSSGHSSDERWYDFMDQPPSTDNSPPPLPTRIGSKSSAFQKVAGGHKAMPGQMEDKKRDPGSQMTPIKGAADSFPAFSNYATPLGRGYNGYESASSSDTVKSSSTIHIMDSGEEKRSVDARSTYLTDYELNNNRSPTDSEKELRDSSSVEREQVRTDEPYLKHERLQALKTVGPATVQQSLAVNTNMTSMTTDQRAMPPPSLTFPLDPGHTTDSSTTSDRLGPLGRSEDELSGVSSHSPHRPRQGGRRNTTGTTTPSSTGSRTSPSTLVGSNQAEQAKKKVGRSARNSANLASSTLQEDLMKLISPDYEEERSEQSNNVQDSPLSKLPKKTLSELSMLKSRSRENIAGMGAAPDNASAEVSFHMARPATVISNNSANSSPNVSNLSANNEQRQSPHVSNVSIKSKVSPTVSRSPPKQEGSGLPNPDTRPGPGGDMDWTSLVDTATKAIYSSSPVPEGAKTSGGEDSAGGLSSREEEVRALLERVAGLEEELAGERRDRGELEAQVDQLKEENVRLQEESQTAAQQLRRFTEWFFQTIDKS